MSKMKSNELAYLKRLLKSRRIPVAVETGTCKGDTTIQLAGLFETVNTIELSEELYRESAIRLSPFNNVFNFHGDSSLLVPVLADAINVRAFWYLDAHWYNCKLGYPIAAADAGEPFPLWAELAAIAKRPFADIIMVDDVHCFGRQSDGPDAEWAGVNAETVAEFFGERCRKHEIVGDTLVLFLRE